MAIDNYSTTPANNSDAPPNGAPEGMAAASVNDTMRQMMADIKGGVAFTVDTKALMSALDVDKISEDNLVLMTSRETQDDNGGGIFRVTKTNISTEVTSDPSEGFYIPFDSDASGASGGFIRNNTDFPIVQWWGVTGSGTETTELQGAFDAVSAVKGVTGLLSLNSLVISIDDTVNIPEISVHWDGAIISYTGTKDRPAMIYGSDTVWPDSRTLKDVRIHSSTTNTSWADENFIGIRLHNVRRCWITIIDILEFTIANQPLSNNQGFKQNEIYIGSMRNCKVGLDMVNDTNGSLAFNNENNFYGGDFNEGSTTLTLGDCYGIRMRDIGPTAGGHNNNRWWGPSFQMASGDPADERIPVLHDNAGSFNTINQCRYETGRGPFARMTSTGVTINNNDYDINFFSGVDSSPTVTEEGDCRMNRVKYSWWKEAQIQYNSPDLTQLVSSYGGTNTQAQGPLHVVNSAGSVTFFATGFTARKDSIEWIGSRALGFYVDTPGSEAFVVSQEGEDSSNLGRIMVAIFDENGDRLTDVSPGAPHLYGKEFGTSTGYVATFGGVYQDSQDFENMPFSVSPSVKKMQIMVAGDCRLKSFGIIRGTPAARPLHVYSGLNQDYNQRYTDGTISTGIVGKYGRGAVVLRHTAFAGNPTYYQCTVAGRYATAWAITTAYDVDTIRENGGNIYTCVTAGTSAGSGGPTGTGTGIVDGTCVWDFLDPQAIFVAGPLL